MEEKQKPVKAALVAERPQKTCFVIGPIGDEDTEIRKKADQVEKYIIRRALEPEYHVERAEAIKRPGIVIDQVVRKVVGADLVVADLADMNPNVFYELGIRHTFGKPTVHLVPTNQKPATPFDVSQIRFIPYELTNPDSVEAAKEDLREQARAITEGGAELITPVQMAEIKHSWDKLGDRDKMIFGVLENVGAAISRIETYTQHLGYQSSFTPLKALVPGSEEQQELFRSILMNETKGLQLAALERALLRKDVLRHLQADQVAALLRVLGAKDTKEKDKPSDAESSETH